MKETTDLLNSTLTSGQRQIRYNRQRPLLAGLLSILLLFTAATARSVTVNDVLQRHLEAMGGKAAIESIKSVQSEADVTVGGMKGTSVTYYKAPDKFRSDVILPIMSTIQGCDGDNCWMSDPQGLTHEVGHELKRIMVTQRSLVSYDFAEPEKFAGTLKLLDDNASLASDSSNTKYFILEITPKGGASARLWIDQNTYLITQMTVKTDLGLLITEFSDYRKVAGVEFAYRNLERTDAGIVAAASQVTSVEINPELSDTLFVEPAKRDQESAWSLSSDSLEIPCNFWHNHLYISGKIGSKGPYNFIFDTGAGGLALSSGLVKALDLKVMGTTEARGVGGAEASKLYQLNSFEIGPLQLDSIPVSSIDFGSIEASGTKRIDGIIGYTLLSRYIVAIDYGRNKIVLYPQNTKQSNWGSECKLTVDFHLPYMDATVNDSIVGTFRIDTGSISTLDLNSPFVRAYSLIDTTGGDYIELTSVGVGGTSKGLVAILDRLDLCGYQQDSIWTGFSASNKGIFSGASTAGNIGAGILKRFRVTFDYNAGKVYFQPVNDYDHLSRVRNMAGLALNKLQNLTVVTFVMPGHAASDVLDSGDVLLKVDDADTDTLSVAQINRLLVGSGRTVKVEFERGGKHHSGKFHLESYF